MGTDQDATRSHATRLAAFVALVRLHRQFSDEHAAQDRADAIVYRVLGWLVTTISFVVGCIGVWWLFNPILSAPSNYPLLARTAFWVPAAALASASFSLTGLVVAGAIRSGTIVPWIGRFLNTAMLLLVLGALAPVAFS
jgi:hypothetical protein